VALDDATSELYYARFVPQENTLTMMAALKAVLEERGLFCTLYTDQASHFVTTRKGTALIGLSRLLAGPRLIVLFRPESGNGFLLDHSFKEFLQDHFL
jgi:hypothetical protein